MSLPEVNSATSFEQLQDVLQAKFSILKICNLLRGGWGEDTVEEMNGWAFELCRMLIEIETHKAVLLAAREQITTVKDLLKDVSHISERLLYMKTHLPKHLPCEEPPVSASSNGGKKITACSGSSNGGKMSTTSSASSNEGRKINTGNKKFDFEIDADKNSKNLKPLPKIQYITKEEFDSVPNYVKGRIQYDKINNTAQQVNKTLESKYSLLRRPRSKLSPLELNMVVKYREQVNEETKGLHFIVDEDLKKFSNIRLDAVGRNLLTILRTLKRIKEVRGPGSLLRYCIIV